MIVYCGVCKTNTIQEPVPVTGHRPQCSQCHASAERETFDYYLKTWPMPKLGDIARLHIGTMTLTAKVLRIQRASAEEIDMRDRYWAERDGK